MTKREAHLARLRAEPVVTTLVPVGITRLFPLQRPKPHKRESLKPRPYERPWKGVCNACAGLPHRVEGARCAECGLEAR